MENLTDEQDVRISCRLNSQLHERLKNLSEKTGRPKTFFITSALEAMITKLEEAYLPGANMTEENRKKLLL